MDIGFETILKVFVPFVVMMPFVEMPWGVPFALIIAKLELLPAAVLLLGGHFTLILILSHVLYKHGLDFAEKHILAKKIISRAQKINLERFKGIPELGVIAIMAFPLPVTGAWFAIPAAFMLNIKKRRAIAVAMLGSVMAMTQGLLIWTGIYKIILPWLTQKIL
ncbi:MAG: hypothetical protein A3A80_01530 [Candidatus Terrybacteria bacterium RIFCSPLOWO2_01_FULL_44_24]|uniref:Small multi-drug export protein n=1 Tax=Candidatus Terrybacteria bacterium RIFCSPHIGHO2_01_FULL_43_35 TaxID=1802361 RepID=A0A1G2PFG9_9BACT|nr:MAG: hypothetical protein A2828_03905 [Candidatus Terrybacteria bacterium RIFCSPHIGHO2_01_FULL_43_35]OHA49919.1 MAG: hypothetical protein A3B75_03395 [Candidatus Terrybacteria bacterium RIFCSPHIGHO2_02_FULL_43_14]OHA51760.1 MAG: hypothetical protein A3A80_01530 [Candidatus Terrybacteria bacterium RIFCSPLOWO2_01_FULL_44_24]